MPEVFAKPAVSAIIEKTENWKKYVLLQRRQKEGGGATNGLIEVVGGKIREYENIFDALRREVREETGLTVTEIEGEASSRSISVGGAEVMEFVPFCSVQNLSGIYSLIMHTFICRAEGELLSETNETTEVHWESVETVKHLLEEAPQLIFPMDILPLKKYLEIL